MTAENREKFREICAKRGCRKDWQIAEKLGFSREVLSRKLNGKVYFTIPEISKICDLFAISKKEAAELFIP